MNSDELDGIDEWGEWLEALLHKPCSVWEEESGELILLEVRQLVERVNGFRIEMGSTPILRTLQRGLIMGKRSVYVEEKKVQPRVQAGRS